MIPSEQRANLVAMYEGHALQAAGNHGSDGACDLARCSIDGNFNAILRLQGSEIAAEYAFALADRVVGRLKTPTPWPPTPARITEPPITLEMIAAPKSESPAPRKLSARMAFGLGFLAGLVVGAAR